jgi:anti-repressor protein
MQDGEPWWVANDVAQALEYRGAETMTRNLDDEEKGAHILCTLGGDQKVTIINESGLYSAVLKSRKESAKRFKKWVTGEVLPSIRKTGTFGAPAVNLADASSLRGLLLGYTEQVLKLEQKVAADKPKVEYHDAVKASVESLTMLQVANKYGIGRTKLFKFLKDYGVIRNDEHNPPYQRYIDSGHFEVDPKFYKEKGKFVHYTQTKVTGKGEIYIGKLLRKAGLVGSGE